jgi:hypothetical protein
VLEESDFAGKDHKMKASHVWAVFAAYRKAGEKGEKNTGGFKQHIPAVNNLILHGVLPPAAPAEPPRDNLDSEPARSRPGARGGRCKERDAFAGER